VSDNPPKLDNAPGHRIRRRKEGWAVIWQCRSDLARRDPGYKPVSRRICIIGDEPTEIERAFISQQCNLLQDDMILWSKGGVPVLGQFDGSWGDLIRHYLTDPDSPHHKKRYRSRRNAQSFFKIIGDDHGKELVGETKARHFLRWHETWTERGVVMAHALMGYVRSLCTFGKTILDDEDCSRAKELLRDMKFKNGQPRTVVLSFEQVIAVRGAFIEAGKLEMALAQSLQYEMTSRQKDIIGEWIPQSEPGISDVIDGNNKWLCGLRWEEIDEDFIVHHTTSKRGKDMPDPDLKYCPLVLEDFERIAPSCVSRDAAGTIASIRRDMFPATGPVIVNPKTRLPYGDDEFRKIWRKYATKVGIPKNVKNMDSRAGAITEALRAGASLEDVRKTATHSQISTTARYSRADKEAAAAVKKRVLEHRNKTGTSSA
jgi:hypothetical protein